MNRSVEAIINHPVKTALAAATAPAVAFAINCGGDNKAPTPSDTIIPTATILRTDSPMPSQTVGITPIPTEAPTIAPTPEPSQTPVEWSEENITAQIDSALNLAIVISKLSPDVEILTSARNQTQTASDVYNQIIKTKDYKSITSPVDGFISAARNIGNFACYETYRDAEGHAYVELKNLVLTLALKYESSGDLEAGSTETYKQLLALPQNCTNQVILSSNN